ncbi:MAG: signal peptidase II [bacterium]
MNTSEPRQWTGLVWLNFSVLWVVADQLSKVWAVNTLNYARPVEVFSFMNWTLLYNKGAAFSFLSEAGGWQRWGFSLLAIGVVIWLLLWLKKIKANQWIESVALSLIVAGAIGNTVDRIRLGHVVDFIDFYYQQWHWPAFNIADISVVCGALMLLFINVFRESEQ